MVLIIGWESQYKWVGKFHQKGGKEKTYSETCATSADNNGVVGVINNCIVTYATLTLKSQKKNIS